MTGGDGYAEGLEMIPTPMDGYADGGEPYTDSEINEMVAAAIVRKMRDGSKPAQELVTRAIAAAPESRTDFQRALFKAAVETRPMRFGASGWSF